jgi:hypothetical protein
LQAIAERAERAAASIPSLEKDLRSCAIAARAVRADLAKWSAGVMAIITDARALNPEPAGPSGPRASSGHVALAGTTLAAGRLTLTPLTEAAATKALERVSAAGRDGVDAAIADAMHMITSAAITKGAEPDITRVYFRAERSGAVHSFAPGTIPPGIAHQVRTGELVQLSDAERDAYLAAEDFQP